MREKLRLPNNKVKKRLDTVGIPLSESTKENASHEQNFGGYYKDSRQKNREGPATYVDETGIR